MRCVVADSWYQVRVQVYVPTSLGSSAQPVKWRCALTLRSSALSILPAEFYLLVDDPSYANRAMVNTPGGCIPGRLFTVWMRILTVDGTKELLPWGMDVLLVARSMGDGFQGFTSRPTRS